MSLTNKYNVYLHVTFYLHGNLCLLSHRNSPWTDTWYKRNVANGEEKVDEKMGSSWSVKYPFFCQKPPIWTVHHIFLDSRHPDVTKNLNYVLSTRWSQISTF